ncbi:1-acyl-sn-glycerol-3-phosphate acyltransferase [Microbispora sp. SCL1-1]|uniref:lysophospholipid acyltransferase family protein n=1 Tax=unclassified Microbispora TaxID=2614687 RepID=UPI001156E437|nr:MULTISPECIES: lysophospholipid acyltransferase family protein [unclassified Microbispora]NJP25423.1 1-acyl-sn-glycerol-3-phosphate acyltransferase [Microbispora sp. CL1-1]TQS13392.1 1-acyl-sn-glycerol-3-phosphate acyltransferase [Microbispora sp. SCL1-1]
MSAVTHLPAASSAWLPASPCAPDLCVRAQARTAGPLRRAARLLGVVVVLLAGLPIALALGRTAWREAVTTRWSRLLLRALGVRIVTRRGFSCIGGSARARAVPEEDGPALLVGNHVSWLDPLVITATFACRPLAKAEVGRWPVVRTLAAGGGALFIDRDRPSALPEVVADMTAALRRGESVAAFPEGTTWCGREMGRFRPAVFQAAIDAGVPVRPVALRFLELPEGAGTGVSTRPSYVGDDTLLASVLRIVAARDLVAEVTVFPGVRLDRPPVYGSRAHRRQARAELARIAEAQVRTGLVEPGERAAAA